MEIVDHFAFCHWFTLTQNHLTATNFQMLKHKFITEFSSSFVTEHIFVFSILRAYCTFNKDENSDNVTKPKWSNKKFNSIQFEDKAMNWYFIIEKSEKKSKKATNDWLFWVVIDNKVDKFQSNIWILISLDTCNPLIFLFASSYPIFSIYLQMLCKPSS